MIKVITYGTFDLFHEGHLRLLKRAKALGDYLIVGVTSDSFDKERGKINVKQSLAERIESVKKTGLADEIIVEEYEGQKIDDVRRLGIDIFTVGSDWKGKFDYLKEYCQVIYLERTKGISSTEIRTTNQKMRLGLVGNSNIVRKFYRESSLINGIEIIGDYPVSKHFTECKGFDSYDELLSSCDAVYICSAPEYHYDQIKTALETNHHVLCESPICLSVTQYDELVNLAKERHLILTESIKTAYSTAYYRLLLLLKTGIIGDVISVDATSTSIRTIESYDDWSGICAWGPTDLLPIFQVLGCDFSDYSFVTKKDPNNSKNDLFTKININFASSTATAKAATGVKSEGELIISGTKGYIYVPAPWWLTDYFEIRFENSSENKKVFYPLEGEGIRYELLSFCNSIRYGKDLSYIQPSVSRSVVQILEAYYQEKNMTVIK